MHRWHAIMVCISRGTTSLLIRSSVVYQAIPETDKLGHLLCSAFERELTHTSSSCLGLFTYNRESGYYWFNTGLEDCEDEYGFVGVVSSLPKYTQTNQGGTYKC